MRKFIGKFLAAGLCVAMALSSVTVKADSVDQKYLALGADLTASQKINSIPEKNFMMCLNTMQEKGITSRIIKMNMNIWTAIYQAE